MQKVPIHKIQRSKERTIGEALMMVKVWRILQLYGKNDNGEILLFNRLQAAKDMRLSERSLRNYFTIIRQTIDLVDFNKILHKKIGYLKDQIKIKNLKNQNYVHIPNEYDNITIEYEQNGNNANLNQNIDKLNQIKESLNNNIISEPQSQPQCKETKLKIYIQENENYLNKAHRSILMENAKKKKKRINLIKTNQYLQRKFQTNDIEDNEDSNNENVFIKIAEILQDKLENSTINIDQPLDFSDLKI